MDPYGAMGSPAAADPDDASSSPDAADTSYTALDEAMLLMEELELESMTSGETAADSEVSLSVAMADAAGPAVEPDVAVDADEIIGPDEIFNAEQVIDADEMIGADEIIDADDAMVREEPQGPDPSFMRKALRMYLYTPLDLQSIISIIRRQTLWS